MRIACLLRSLEMGGVERQLTGLATFLKQEGHDVVILKYIHDDFFSKTIEEEHIPTKEIKKSLGYIRMAKRIAGFIKKNNIDLLISYGTSPNIKACIAKLIYNDFKLIVSERNFNVKWSLVDRIRFQLYRKADAIVSNSISQGRLINEKFSHSKNDIISKSSVIVNFTDLDRFIPSSCSDKRGKDTLKIITTGRVVRRKNIHGYIDAINILRNKGYKFKIEWYGLKQESAYFKRCRKKIKKYKLDDVFNIYPALNNIEEIYKKADVFCLPSFYEGTSNAISEALACGLPIICSDVSDNSINVMEDVNGWLFDPNDISSITDAFERMFKVNDECLRAFGAKSREIASERLSKSRFVNQYKDLINNIMNHNPMRPE